MSANEVVDVLLVGLGRQGRRHMRIIEAETRARLWATVDPVAEGGEQAPHFRSVADAVDAMKGRLPDAAVVSTPAADHVATTSMLMMHGIPTLVEKPLALSASDGELLAALSESSGTMLVVGHVERFNPCVRLVAALLHGGTVGVPVACSFRRVGLPPPSRPDVDVVADLGVHDLDVFRMLMADAVSLRGASGWIGDDGLIESAHVLVAAGSVHGMVEVNWRTPVRIRGFNITTDTCLVEVNYTTQSVDVVEASHVADFEEFAAFQSHYGAARRTRMEARQAEPLAEQFGAFVEAVSGCTPGFLATASDGANAVGLAEAASLLIHGSEVGPLT